MRIFYFRPHRIATDRASLVSGREGDGDTRSVASGHSRGSRGSRRRGSRARERRGSYGRDRGKSKPPVHIDRENEIWIDKGPEGDQQGNNGKIFTIPI